MGKKKREKKKKVAEFTVPRLKPLQTLKRCQETKKPLVTHHGMGLWETRREKGLQLPSSVKLTAKIAPENGPNSKKKEVHRIQLFWQNWSSQSGEG